MGRFIARQPNGLLCRFSTIVDTIIDSNMTEEEYIEMCAEEAREMARENLKNPRFIKPFSWVREHFSPTHNTREEFIGILREMGDTETQVEDLKDICHD